MYIAKEDMIVGAAYALDARNILVGIWDGKKFHGIREKFGTKFMETENHWDDGAPFGTVKPLAQLVVV